MSTLQKIYKGEDAAIEITINGEDGNALDLTNPAVLGLLVVLYYKKDTIVDSFSLNTQAGFTDLLQTDLANGKVTAPLNSAKTISISENILKAEIKLALTDTDYDNNTFWDTVSEVEVAEVVSSVTQQNSSF